MKVQWNLRCQAEYQKKAPVLDEFIARWATVLRRWRAERDMSYARADLHRFVGILDGWFDSPLMPKFFPTQPKPPTNARPPQQQDKLALKEAKGGGVQRQRGKEAGVVGGGRLDGSVYRWVFQDGKGGDGDKGGTEYGLPRLRIGIMQHTSRSRSVRA